VRLLWSHQLAVPLRGLSLARERSWLFGWDARDGLYLWDHQGNLQAQARAPSSIASAAAAADGRHFVVLSQEGRMWSFAPDLTLRWEHGAAGRGGAVAIASEGERIAAAIGGSLYLLDDNARGLWAVPVARPLRHMVFVPEKPLLIGSADYGFVGCFDATGKMHWRDTPVANVGSLAVNGSGDCIVLACFSDGVCSYTIDRSQSQRLAGEATCHLADVSYKGDALLMAGVENHVYLRTHEGSFRGQLEAGGFVVGIALAPMADYLVVATGEGTLAGFAPHGDRPPPP
jgi:hypothetical protein